jgi:hypothetical protein
MSQQCISINVEGDFIDSYIYSGTLFLVHADSKITTHNWEALLASALHNNNHIHGAALTFDFLKDCRKSAQLTDRDSKTIYIDKDELEEERISTLPLDGWPTDINIYGNRFYIASENGVEELPFNWEKRKIESTGRFHVWRKYAYKVSANDAHRLAIAAGPNGVITVSPRGGYINEREDIATLLEIDSHDCEWVGRSLIANSLDGAFLSTFPDLPKRPEGPVPPGYWKQFNEIKKQPPTSQRVAHNGPNAVVYAWMAGSKLFSLLSNGKLSVEGTNEAAGSKQTGNRANEAEIGMGNRFSNMGNFLAARSGLFGTVIEIGDELCEVTEHGTETVSIRPVSWRVFPRAKSYLNHLHIIEKDQLSIRAYFPSVIQDQTDRFGIRIEDVL